MAYMLGFISADGTVSTPNGRIKISLQRQDKELLEKFKDELQWTGVIRDSVAKMSSINKEYPISTLTIFHGEMVKKLKQYNIVDNKSLIIRFPIIPNEFVIDYIRGYFDGNGSVGIQYPKNSNKGIETKTAQIRIRICCGSEEFLTSIRDILYICYGLREVKLHKRENKNMYEICYSTKDSIKLHNLFYADTNCLCLSRKKNSFDQYIKIREIDKNNSTGYIKVS